MLTRLQAVPFPVRFSWLWPVFSVLAALALSQLDTGTPRPVFAHMALFDATVSTALLTLLLTPRAERTLKQPFLLVLRGVALAALAFPEVRIYLRWELVSLLISAAFLLRGLHKPLPEGFDELDDLERTYAFWPRLTRSPRAVRPVLYELTLYKHLLVSPRLPEGQHFGTRLGAQTGSIFTLLAFGTVVEGMLSHVLLERWQPLVAWGWTGLNALGLVWMFAYGRALSTRPVTVSRRRLYLRSGLHWTGSTSLANVESARVYNKETDTDALNIAIDVKPNVALVFVQPVTLLGVYWVEKQVQQVALHVDDPKAFMLALGQQEKTATPKE